MLLTYMTHEKELLHQKACIVSIYVIDLTISDYLKTCRPSTMVLLLNQLDSALNDIYGFWVFPICRVLCYVSGPTKPTFQETERSTYFLA